MDKTTYFYPNLTMRAGGRIVDFHSPLIMGILNVTPDSFYDGGAFRDVSDALTHAMHMADAGADIIDIGGMSSRPGATLISPAEELSRVIPVITAIRSALPDILLSIDTIHSEVADQAIQAGAHIINDISAGAFDPKLIGVAAHHQVPYILMHMQGKPENMQANPAYSDITAEIMDFFIQKVHQIRAQGVTDIILDPGFGFGKDLNHNYTLLRDWDQLMSIGLPMLAGVSRKSMVCRLLGVKPEQALNGSTALHALLLQKGAHILRVHDVREAAEVRSIVRAAQSGKVF